MIYDRLDDLKVFIFSLLLSYCFGVFGHWAHLSLLISGHYIGGIKVDDKQLSTGQEMGVYRSIYPECKG